MLSEDIFAKIVSRELPADIVFETENILAFKDIHPKAKTHIIIIPKEALKTAKEVSTENVTLFGELFLAAKKIAEMLDMPGYKLHMNVDKAGGQVVPRVHLHLLSGDFKTVL